MIRIRVLSGLVFQSSLHLLTTQNGIRLQCFLSKEPLSINIGVTFGRDVQKLESRSLPKIIAAIDELVDTTVKASFFSDLSLGEPLGALV